MPPKLGIVAGGGRLPRLLARHCLDTGRAVYVIVLQGQGEGVHFQDLPHESFRLGAAGGMIRRLKRENVEEIVFAGQVRKPPLSALWPDAWSLKFLARTGVFGKGDNTFLETLIRALENEGFRVVGADQVLPHLLTPEQPLTTRTPTDDDARDIELGIGAALGLGARDQGQAVVVVAGRVVAEEGPDGTDAMLSSLAGDNARPALGGILVKVMKPGQERRADLPVIGPQTIRNAAAAGLRGVVLSAGSSLILDRPDVVEAANGKGLFVVGRRVPDGGPEGIAP